MTIRFAQELKSKFHCASCSSPHAPARKFCEQHLATAREHWHRHVKKCKAEGRCINCTEKKLRGEQRCQTCKTRNRNYCGAWWRANADRLKQRRRDRIAAGMCGSCGKRPREAGHERCKVCYPKGYRS